MGSEFACPRTTTSVPQVNHAVIVGKNWAEYEKEYKLRTDAVWEKQQLKDWFRLTNKV